MIRSHIGDGPVWEGAEYDDSEVINGVPDLTAVEYRKEREFKSHLIALLEAHDWNVETEVFDDDRNGRIDIVAEHPSVGCVGIEIKRTYRCNTKHIAEGFGQILNYRSYTYSDHDIDYWALAPGFDASASKRKKQVRNMFRRTLAELKLGMVSRHREAICFGKQLEYCIPLRDPETVTQADLDTINGEIAKREWEVSEYEPNR
ncbi:hypothetical protein [Halorubrum sp. DM2]|uniref:hypothetical protein n=1 Tax=Halorubrum sp. DM2 TaxID=2527867 RepID=UPI0024B6BE6A|nr:hypothetical protein [Halorubrum sp. DM2]